MVSFESTDPVEQFLIEVHNLRTSDGQICNYRMGVDLQDEIRIAKILVAKIAAAEREACAQLTEQMGIDGYDTLAIGAAIRARGKA
jgi:hypothetical protein